MSYDDPVMLLFNANNARNFANTINISNKYNQLSDQPNVFSLRSLMLYPLPQRASFSLLIIYHISSACMPFARSKNAVPI